MAVPDTPHFEAFLSESAVVRDKPKDPFVYFCDSPVRSGFPELYLRYPATDLKLDSVLKVISRSLADNGCAANEDIAISVLGLIVETHDRRISAVAHANACLTRTHVAQVRQIVVIPSPVQSGYDSRIGEIQMTGFDPEKLLYWTKRAGCGYPIDLMNLKGKFSFERDRFDTRLINWDENPGNVHLLNKWGEEISIGCLLDSYYQAVYRLHSSEVPQLLRDRLLLLEGGGLVYINERSILRHPLANHIGFFQWRGSGRQRGWALLGRGGVHLTLTPVGAGEKARDSAGLLGVARQR